MIRPVAFLATACIALITPAFSSEQTAIDACIDQLRVVGGPDAADGGEVVSSDFSEAGTLVMLKDAGGTVWRCLSSNDGKVEELAVADAADDGGGAMAGSDPGATSTVVVKFAHGASSAAYDGTLTPGASVRYVLGARNGQFLQVDIAAEVPDISYQIFNPDQSFLLDLVSSGLRYEGQLWQSGDHVVEVINRGNAAAPYGIRIDIK